MDEFLFVALLYFVVSGIVCALLAEDRDLAPAMGFMLGLMFGIFGVIYLALRHKHPHSA